MSAGFYYPVTVLVWHAGYVYLHQYLNYVAVNRLGEVCLYVTIVTSCMINAKEARQQTGADSCTSLYQSYLPCLDGVILYVKQEWIILPLWSYNNILKPAFSSEIRFKGRSTRKRNAALHSKQHWGYVAWSFFKYTALQEVVGKWYTRVPIAQSDKSCTSTTAARSTMEEEGNYDDSEDESWLWCYCEQPCGQIVMCDKKSPIS